MTKTYGIISDLHHADISMLEPTIDILKREGVDSLILNGDLMGESNNPNMMFVNTVFSFDEKNFQKYDLSRKDKEQIQREVYFSKVLEAAGKSGLETFVVPGGHETFSTFNEIMGFFSSRYPNLINTVQYRKVVADDHHIVFLPGSDAGTQEMFDRGFIIDDRYQTGQYFSGKGDEQQPLWITNPNDLKEIVTEPEKTVVVGHIPRKFDNIKGAVDGAYIGQFMKPCDRFYIQCADGSQGSMIFYQDTTEENLKKRFAQAGATRILSKEEIKEGTKISRSEALEYQRIFPDIWIDITTENRGSEALQKVLDELNITKAVNSHFHESSGNAHDINGKPIEPCLFVPSLFYNASSMDDFKAGMLTVAENKAAYENIDLSKHLVWVK